jgi:hypothetical protein
MLKMTEKFEEDVMFQKDEIIASYESRIDNLLTQPPLANLPTD